MASGPPGCPLAQFVEQSPGSYTDPRIRSGDPSFRGGALVPHVIDIAREPRVTDDIFNRSGRTITNIVYRLSTHPPLIPN